MFKRIIRLYKIVATIWQFRLYNLLLSNINKKNSWLGIFSLLDTWRKPSVYTRGEALCLALESLGPIFIKFGQMLSTRADMIPVDIAKALTKLQDKVPPFDGNLAIQIIEQSLRKPLEQIFIDFDANPIASASMAQVHKATLAINKTVNNLDFIEYKKVAVKVLRPDMLPVIEVDLAIMRIVAFWLEKIWADAKRLKPQEIINEFDTYLHNELDLMIEAANASQLSRNMQRHSETKSLILVPEIYFDWCSTQVLTMQYMNGIQIAKTAELINNDIDLKKLASDGVQIFFSQVFRDGFFHADMHPGNILISVDKDTNNFSKYIALDFGIMGSLSAFDKHYLAHNFLAFFERDYKRVALLHVESGWVPHDVNIEALESAIRACCEPYFDKPLKDISLGIVLMRLFQTAKQFELNIQPQLILLQKTLLNIESLGRELDPDLDLWKTAKPILQKWVSEQIGWRSFMHTLRQEAPLWGKLIPQIPRLMHEKLHNKPYQNEIALILAKQHKLEAKLNICIAFVGGGILGFLMVYAYNWI